jgi:hypothetical protein
MYNYCFVYNKYYSLFVNVKVLENSYYSDNYVCGVGARETTRFCALWRVTWVR